VKTVRPYTALAKIYDVVMEHVDYEAWADYVWHLIDENLPDYTEGDGPSILELGAGTALLTEELLDQGVGNVLATDSSAEMLELAQNRLNRFEGRFQVQKLDFEGDWGGLDGLYDVILLMYDGFNYARTDEGVDRILAGMADRLKPGGIVIFDQSTPANSINNAAFFEDEGESGAISFVRKSSFDIEVGLHTTEFEIKTPQGQFFERHVQRAWTRRQVIAAVDRSRFRIKTAFDGFSLDPAHDDAERIHWVLELED